MLRAAFRDAHGARLNGFALLLTLGDAPLANALAAHAVDEGARQAKELRHPERAAAWLRGRVLRAAPKRLPRRGGPGIAARRAALARLGVDDLTYGTLVTLSVNARAALIASATEGFSLLDLELVLGTSAHAVRRQVAKAQLTFVERQMAHEQPGSPRVGPLAMRVRDIADRAISGARP
jgi:hypothetical protein